MITMMMKMIDNYNNDDDIDCGIGGDEYDRDNNVIIYILKKAYQVKLKAYKMGLT